MIVYVIDIKLGEGLDLLTPYAQKSNIENKKYCSNQFYFNEILAYCYCLLPAVRARPTV